MAWRLIEVPDNEQPDDLTNGELIGVSILLAQGMAQPHNDNNVYYRAWEKIQPQVEQALESTKNN